MAQWIMPVTFVVLLWWSSTVLVLRLARLTGDARRRALLAGGAGAALALLGLAASARQATAFAAYQSFVYALVIWGSNEIAFLTGVLTGPRTRPCTPELEGWRRLFHAARAISHHELALLGTGGLVLAVSVGTVNPTGAWTFGALWLMRLSSKLNLFLGVPNLGVEMLPADVRYLRVFFRQRPMNLLFPLTVTALTLWLVQVVDRASLPGLPEQQRTGCFLLSALIGLGLLEHWLLVLPLRAERLWGTGTRATPRAATANAHAALVGRLRGP